MRAGGPTAVETSSVRFTVGRRVRIFPVSHIVRVIRKIAWFFPSRSRTTISGKNKNHCDQSCYFWFFLKKKEKSNLRTVCPTPSLRIWIPPLASTGEPLSTRNREYKNNYLIIIIWPVTTFRLKQPDRIIKC